MEKLGDRLSEEGKKRVHNFRLGFTLDGERIENQEELISAFEKVSEIVHRDTNSYSEAEMFLRDLRDKFIELGRAIEKRKRIQFVNRMGEI